LLASALVVRVALAPLWANLPNNFSDEGCWKDWMAAIHQHGLLNIFRAADTDYVGYQYVLWLLSAVYTAIGGSDYGHEVFRLHLLVKAPSLLFDTGLIVATYVVSRSLFEELRVTRAKSMALVAAAIIAFHPAVLYDSAVWAQTDSAVTLAMLLSIFFAVRGRTKLAFAVWAVGFLVKPHPIIVLPLLIYLTFRRNPRALLPGLTTAAAIGVVALAPWLLHGDGGQIRQIYRNLFDADYQRLSAQAWNLWWFADISLHPKPDQAMLGFISYRMLGLIFTVSAGFLALFYLHARANLRGALIAAAYLAFAFYFLPVSSHDRYLYPFFAFMLPVAVIERRWRPLYVVASIAFFFNLTVVAPPVHAFSERWIGSPFTIGVAALNCVLFGLFTSEIARVALPSLRRVLLRSSQGARTVFRGLPYQAR
jgi:Gpi18-like mannosyltransferase